MAIIVPILTTFNDKGVKSAINEFKRAEGSLNKFRVGVKNLAVPAAIVFAGITAGLISSIKAAEEAQVANKRLANVLKQMGYAEATNRVQSYADALSRQIGKEDEAIKLVQAKLATFKNLTATINTTNGAFDRATKAAFDLAAAGFGEAEQSATQLGKALQDPIKGITALARSGVTFTDVEKAKIKALVESGNILEAQNVLLIAIENQVGGTAEATATASEKMKIAFGEAQEALGKALLPAFERLAPVVEKLFKFIEDNSDIFITLALVITGVTAAVIGLNIALALNPFTWIIVGIGAAIVLIALAIQRFEYLKLTVMNIAAAIAQVFVYMANVAADVLTKMVNEFIKAYNRYLLPAIKVFKQDAQSIAMIDFTKPFDDANAAIDAFGAANRKTRAALDYNIDAIGAVTDAVGSLTPSIDDFEETTSKATKASDKLTKAMQAQKKAAQEAAEAIVNNLEKSLQSAESQLDSAKSAFTNFKDSIKGVVTGILNFGNAAEEGSFIENITKQAADATVFADKVKKLIVGGLSERAIQQVLDAGFEAGSKIADEIIAGGATMIEQVNTLVASVDSIAETIGTYGADVFYGEGVRQGEALVSGIRTALEAARAELLALQQSLTTGANAPTVTPSSTPGPTPRPTPRPLSSALSSSQFATASSAASQFGTAAGSYTALAFALQNQRKKFAKGGIVTGPTNALIGEAGPEAVIPLSGANSASLGATYNITVNAGIGTSGSQVGREIVDAIKKFEKTSGPVFASA